MDAIKIFGFFSGFVESCWACKKKKVSRQAVKNDSCLMVVFFDFLILFSSGLVNFLGRRI